MEWRIVAAIGVRRRLCSHSNIGGRDLAADEDKRLGSRLIARQKIGIPSLSPQSPIPSAHFFIAKFRIRADNPKALVFTVTGRLILPDEPSLA
jgi:hypothetical protein